MAEAKDTTGAAPATEAAPTTEAAPKAGAPGKGSKPVEVSEYQAEKPKGTAGNGASTPPTKESGDANYTPFFLMGGVVLLFYFMIMRPQKKREQQRKEMLGQLKAGEKVITASGIVGEIVELTETDAVLKIDPRKDVRMRVRRAAVAGPAGDAGSEEAVSGSGS